MYEKVSQKEVCCKIASIIQGEIALLFQNPPRPPHNGWIFVKELVQFNQGKSSFIPSWKARLICPQFHLPSAKNVNNSTRYFHENNLAEKKLSAYCIYLFTKINGFQMSYLSRRLMKWSLRFLCHSLSIHSLRSVFILQFLRQCRSCKFSWRLQELFMTHIKNVSIWWWTRILEEISMEEMSQHHS